MTIIAADLLPELRTLARRAGGAIMEIYATDFAVERKSDHSPVTEADIRAEAIILETLSSLTPGIPVIAEEQAAAHGIEVPAGNRFWLVDPLDGTREFLNRNGEFTVNIALIENGRPTLGVVHAPARSATYLGAATGGATRQIGEGVPEPITVRPPPAEGLTVIASRRHGSSDGVDRFLAGRPVARRITCGSSLKFCLIAAGEADLYPRFGPTMEWDTAAGHAVLNAAGGCVTTLDGAELRYGKPDFLNPDFIAWGGNR